MDDSVRQDISDEFPWMCRFARSLTRHDDDGDDIATDCYIKAMGSEFEGRSSLRTWLASIIRCRFIDVQRSRYNYLGFKRLESIDDFARNVSRAHGLGTDEVSHDVEVFGINPYTDVDDLINIESILDGFNEKELDSLYLGASEMRDKYDSTKGHIDRFRRISRERIGKKAIRVLQS